MQTGKKAVDSVREGASNIAASARSGMEKTKAIMQEKVEKMTTHDEAEKEMATQKKEQLIQQAELNKQQAREHNAANTTASTTPAAGTNATQSYSATGAHGHTMGLHQMSALPGHGTGQPAGQVTEGTVGAHPIGKKTGTQTNSASHNTKSGGTGGGYGYGTGGGPGGGYTG